MSKKDIREEKTRIIHIAGAQRGMGATSLTVCLGMYISAHHNEYVLCEEDFKAGERVWFEERAHFRQCAGEGIYRFKKFHIKKRENIDSKDKDILCADNYMQYNRIIRDCGMWHKDVFDGCHCGIIIGSITPWGLKRLEEIVKFYSVKYYPVSNSHNLLYILRGNVNDKEIVKFKKKYGINCIHGIDIQNPFKISTEELNYLYLIFEHMT